MVYKYRTIAVCSLALLCFLGCKRSIPLRNSGVIDLAFTASIAPGRVPYEYLVTIEKIDPKVKRQIAIPLVTCYIRDSTGHQWESTPEYGEPFSVSGQSHEINCPMDKIVADLIIKNNRLPPGTYEIIPVVRISEVGNDMLQDSNDQYNLSTVAVPAKNSITVRF